MAGAVQKTTDAGDTAAMPPVRYISEPLENRVTFSFCTLVASQASYDRFLASCAVKGFNESNSEFIALDNRQGNIFDGYTAIRRALPECSGKYVVFTHDDIEFTDDTADDLVRILDELTELDPKWTLVGNSGATNEGRRKSRNIVHNDDPDFSGRIDGPVRVQSLDENFFLMRRDCPVPHSFDLEGFHLYASDACLMNEILGGHTYVIPFLFFHHSGGETSEAFKTAYFRFYEKYRPYFWNRHLKMPCALMDFGWRSMFNRVLEKRKTPAEES